MIPRADIIIASLRPMNLTFDNVAVIIQDPIKVTSAGLEIFRTRRDVHQDGRGALS